MWLYSFVHLHCLPFIAVSPTHTFIMNKTIEIQELAFVVAAKNYEPSLLNPGFLKYSGIIPSDWELSRQPVFNDRVAQIVFNNGVNIVGEPQGYFILKTSISISSDCPQRRFA